MTPSPHLSAPPPSSPVAVVGAGFGGLSAAIHLRLAGFDVAVFEANDRVGGRANRIERDGFRFDTGPSLLNYPWVFEDLFAAAGRRLADRIRLRPVEPGIRFRWPDGTSLSLSSDLARLRAEFERLEPGCGPRLAAYLADAERKYNLAFRKLVTQNTRNPVRWFGGLTAGEALATGVWRTLDGELGRFFRSPYLREALGSYGMYLGGSPWELPGLFSILAYGELAYGLWLPAGGIHALAEAIAALARELGVRIETGRAVRRIRVEAGRTRGVEFADGSRADASAVVSNVDVPTTHRELVGIARPAPRMTPGVLTFYWAVRGRPAGLGHHTIFLPDDFRDSFRDLRGRGRIPRQLPFYVSVASGTDASLAPPGDSAVFVLVPTPVLSEMGAVDWPAATAEARGRVLERLRREGVDLPAGRIAFEEVFTPVEWGRRFGLHDGSAFGAAHTMFQLGPFRPPNRDPRIRGLYYVGASTTPGAGLPMVVLGGRMTAEQVAADRPGSAPQPRSAPPARGAGLRPAARGNPRRVPRFGTPGGAVFRGSERLGAPRGSPACWLTSPPRPGRGKCAGMAPRFRPNPCGAWRFLNGTLSGESNLPSSSGRGIRGADMDAGIGALNQRVREESAFVADLRGAMQKVIVGQGYLVDRLVIGLLANGHLLIEGVPGLAKTLSVRTLAAAVDTAFRRIQFTPDLLPADLTGTQVYNPRDGTFSTKKGPIFANVILADEINRAPAKVQSALLEAMQERQVTIGEQSFPLPDPFLVLATQNPIEQEGTYPLPEAQVDRFMLKLKVGYPTKEEERKILEANALTSVAFSVKPVVAPDRILRARAVVDEIYVDEKVKSYIVDLVFASREPESYGLKIKEFVRYGASPRATIYLTVAARAHAFLHGRGYVTPQDVKSIAPDVLRHRIIASYEAEAEGLASDDLVARILNELPVP